MRASAAGLLVSVSVAFSVAPLPSHASEQVEPEPERHYRPNQSPYRLYPLLDASVLVGGAGVALAPNLLVLDTLQPRCGLRCDRNDINGLDRVAVDLGSDTARTGSDILFFASMGLPFVADAIDVAASSPHDGWGGYAVDAVVLFETLGVNFYVQNLVAFAVRRPRPYVYDHSVSEGYRLDGTAALSFYSGHAASAFAGATAYSRLFMLRHPDSPLVVPVWIATQAMAAGASTLRVFCREHFPTDVMAGAVAGVGIGLLVPWLHELPPRGREHGRGDDAGIQVRPWLWGQGAGLTGTFF